jgi:hypothetical protein
MKRLLAIVVFSALAAPAAAQPYYARGSWDDWQDPPLAQFQMADTGDGQHFTATVSPLNPGQTFEYKLAEADYDPAYPSSNAKATANASGEISFHLRTNNFQPWDDGWFPNGPRAGYDDSLLYDWEVVGSFNGWPGTGDTNYYMTDSGNGLHEGTFTFPDAGSHQFKFRQQGSWDASIGLDFGNDNNIALRTWDPNEEVTFRLDLPTGRYQVVPTLPTPDLNDDGYVDAQDYVLWRKSNGSEAQYNRWRAHFGTEPPPPDTSAFYARGGWNGFDLSDEMLNNGGGLYTHTETGLTTGQFYEFKAANNDYSIQAPENSNGPRNVKAAADADGEISLRFFFNNDWTGIDNWMPNNQYRVGYEDSGQHGWELMGEFNGWAGGAQYVLQNDGGGLYSVVATGLAESDADGYAFKFRRHDGTVGNWDVNIGANFGNDAADALTGQIAAGDYKFELDLPNGRWRVSSVSASGSSLTGGTVPEPASLALVLIGVALASAVRRRK